MVCCIGVVLSGCGLLCRCGSGLSGEVLSEGGHVWVGVDISQPMLGKRGVYIEVTNMYCML